MARLQMTPFRRGHVCFRDQHDKLTAFGTSRCLFFHLYGAHLPLGLTPKLVKQHLLHLLPSFSLAQSTLPQGYVRQKGFDFSRRVRPNEVQNTNGTGSRASRHSSGARSVRQKDAAFFYIARNTALHCKYTSAFLRFGDAFSENIRMSPLEVVGERSAKYSCLSTRASGGIRC